MLQYGTFRLEVQSNESSESVLHRAGVYILYVLQTQPLAALLALYTLSGVFWSVSNRQNKHRPVTSVVQRRVLITFGASYALYMVVFLSLNRMNMSPLFQSVQERFWQQPALLVTVFSAMMCSQLSLSRWRKEAVLAGFLSIYAWNCIADIRSSSNGVVDAYGRAILDSLPTGSIVITQGDSSANALSYLQQCESKRLDVTLLHSGKFFFSCHDGQSTD